VLDPFLGSGTTALACIELARHYVGIEISPNYYELASNNIKMRRTLVTQIRIRNGHKRARNIDNQMSPRLL